MNAPPITKHHSGSGWQGLLQLVAVVLLCEGAGAIGALTTTTGQSGWYQALRMPPFHPPGWVFGPVWTGLYLIMGVAAFLVWRNGLERRDVRVGLGMFLVQLVLNAIWTPVFFGLHWLVGGFVVIVVLWVAILVTALWFCRVSRAAGILMIPYLFWVTFAGVLNGAIVVLNY